jgi:hypothetical protein
MPPIAGFLEPSNCGLRLEDIKTAITVAAAALADVRYAALVREKISQGVHS